MKRSLVSVLAIVVVLSSLGALGFAQAKAAAPSPASPGLAGQTPPAAAPTPAAPPASAPAAGTPSTTPAPVLAAAKEYPTFGVAIAPVQGWDRLQGREPEIIVQWCHIDAQAINMDGEIAALIEPAAGRKLDEYAKQAAEEFSMKIEDEKAQLGGQAAIVLTGSMAEKLFHPARAIVCQRGSYFYLLISYGTAGQDWRGELEAMADGWKWIDFQGSDKFVTPLDQKFSLFSGLLSLKAPAILRGYKVPQPDDQAYLGVYDYLLNRPVFTVDVQRMSKDAATAPEAMRQDFARQLDAKLKSDKPLTWQKLPRPMPVFLSGSYDVTPTPQKQAATKNAQDKPAIALPAPTGRMTVRSCLAFPSTADALVITFGIYTAEEPARQAYIDLAEQMALTFTSKPPVSAPANPGK